MGITLYLKYHEAFSHENRKTDPAFQLSENLYHGNLPVNNKTMNKPFGKRTKDTGISVAFS